MSTLVETHSEPSVPSERANAVSHPVDAVRTTLSQLSPIYHAQVQSLLQQLFLQQKSAPVRRVGVTAAEDSAEIAHLCFEMAQVLAEYDYCDVGLIDASPASLPLETQLELAPPETPINVWAIAPRLWFVPRQSWMSGQGHVTEQNAARLRELACEFDFSILYCPGVSVMAGIGRACDGLVLVLTANKTRRLVATQMRDQLQQAHVPVLGTVLRERRRPIPEALYRRL